MAAALAILGEEGPDHFTVRAIAKRAGVAPMAIYNHFGGKNGLLEAIWTDGFTLLESYVTVDTGDPAADTLASGLAYRRFALDHPAHYTVMFLHHFTNFVPSLDAVHLSARTFQVLIGHVEDCQTRGLYTTYPPADILQVFWAACHGYVSLEILSVDFSSDADATFEAMLSALMRGL